MKIRHIPAAQKIQLEMTPMIDVVFQLLVFFIFTFKIGVLEGDFNIKMPAAAPSQGTPDEDQLPPMTLRLTANADGELTGIQLNDIAFGNFAELHEHVVSIIGTGGGPSMAGDVEIEIDCDFGLKYEHVIAAITAVLGHRSEADGTVIRLIEKLRFAPPRKS